VLRASAYLSIFDDWQLLAPSIASIYDRVEEIVVVDGAYRWMAPLFAAEGRDPRRSLPEVYAALAPFAAKLRVIPGLWENEVDKRAAGYAACAERYIFRIDADEVLFFDDEEIERFRASPHGVAEMRMPIALAPGLIRTRPGKPVECQSFLFDRERIGPREHCAYLWLVLPAAERAALPAHRPAMVHQTPIATNAHLTQWRPPRTAINRARFYDMNFLREHRGAPWLVDLVPQDVLAAPGLDDASWFAALFRHLSPRRYTERLQGHPTTLGFTGLDGFGVGPSLLTAVEEQTFAPLFAAQLAALAEQNLALAATPRAMEARSLTMIDLSSPDARAALGGGESVTFAFDTAIADCHARLVWLSATPPFHHGEERHAEITGDRVRVRLPSVPVPGSFRCVLGLSVQALPAAKLIQLRLQV
jgi:hypothetical protein